MRVVNLTPEDIARLRKEMGKPGEISIVPVPTSKTTKALAEAILDMAEKDKGLVLSKLEELIDAHKLDVGHDGPDALIKAQMELSQIKYECDTFIKEQRHLSKISESVYAELVKDYPDVKVQSDYYPLRTRGPKVEVSAKLGDLITSGIFIEGVTSAKDIASRLTYLMEARK